MSPLAAFFFGILFTFIILIPFWFAANIDRTVNTTYRNSVCFGVCEFTGISGSGSGT